MFKCKLSERGVTDWRRCLTSPSRFWREKRIPKTHQTFLILKIVTGQGSDQKSKYTITSFSAFLYAKLPKLKSSSHLVRKLIITGIGEFAQMSVWLFSISHYDLKNFEVENYTNLFIFTYLNLKLIISFSIWHHIIEKDKFISGYQEGLT